MYAFYLSDEMVIICTPEYIYIHFSSKCIKDSRITYVCVNYIFFKFVILYIYIILK